MSVFSKAEINIGIIPTFGGTKRLPRNVGRKAAIELILTGRTFDAAEAATLGPINRVVPAADLLDAALALAMDLAAKPPLTTAAALSAIHRGLDASIDDGLAIEERVRPDRPYLRCSGGRRRIRGKAPAVLPR